MLSLGVVTPLMIYIAAGLLLRRGGVVKKDSCREISRVVFYVLLPALCFTNIIEADFSTVFSDPYLLYLLAGILALFLACMLLVPRFCSENRRRGVLVQSIFRSNDGIFGLAVATALMGAESMGLMTVGVALTVPLFNALAVIDMETFRGGSARARQIVCKIVKNPVVIACALGTVCNLLQVELPGLVLKPLERLADACAPVGFIALGGTLSFEAVRRNLRAIGATALFRLIVSPALFVALFFLLGYRGDHLLVALIIFGAPTAMSTYTMACAMDGDEELASGTVAITSLLSTLSMFLFIFLLKELGVA